MPSPSLSIKPGIVGKSCQGFTDVPWQGLAAWRLIRFVKYQKAPSRDAEDKSFHDEVLHSVRFATFTYSPLGSKRGKKKIA
jgi:hypothetical protein